MVEVKKKLAEKGEHSNMIEKGLIAKVCERDNQEEEGKESIY